LEFWYEVIMHALQVFIVFLLGVLPSLLQAQAPPPVPQGALTSWKVVRSKEFPNYKVEIQERWQMGKYPRVDAMKARIAPKDGSPVTELTGTRLTPDPREFAADWKEGQVLDMTGDGVEDLMLRISSGGAHCCYSYVVYSMAKELKKIGEVELLDCGEKIRVYDLDGNGKPEILTCDARFTYLGNLPYSESPFSPAVYNLGLSGFERADKAFKQVYQADIDRQRQTLAASYRPAAALQIVTDYLLMGEEAKAWEEFEKLYQGQDKEQVKLQLMQRMGLAPNPKGVPFGEEPPLGAPAPAKTPETLPGSPQIIPTAPPALIEQRSFYWLLLALLVLGLWVVFPFLYTAIMALVLGIIFYPFYRRYLQWTGRPSVAAALSVLTVVFLIILPAGVLLTLITSQIAGIVQVFSATPDKVSGLLVHWENYFLPLVERFEHLIGAELNVMDWFWQTVQRVAQTVAKYSPSVVTGTANFFLNLFIMLLLLFYVFRDGNRLYERLLKLSPIKDKYERRLATEIQDTIYGIFYGSFLTGALQAVLATGGYYLAGIPGALVWGVITFFVSFIPLLGTAAVIVPLLMYLMVIGHYGHALFLAIYGALVIGMVDNFLRPFLIKSNLHQAFLFLGLFGGMAVFGPIGILLGPIIMALLSGMLGIYEQDYLPNEV
jgi:predicted PurR-regulated permease PerM